METYKTSSTVVVVDVGEHLFKVAGHSRAIGALTSETFRVGGHDWAILYYPNGDPSIVDGQFTSVFIQLMSTIESEVTASFSFSFQDRHASPATSGVNKKSVTKTFSPSIGPPNWGFTHFMSKEALADSGCLEDDCLVIKTIVEISQLSPTTRDHDSSISVPPSTLSIDLRDILERGLKADLEVKIGESSKTFSVNTCVLRARSPVFREQLCDPMVRETTSSICIEDMDAKVFEVLLHYMYNDRLPGFMEETTEEAASITPDLLVAANRYGIERLKVMCERRMCQSLNVETVSFTLDLAERYDCQQLKECCLKYMAKDGDRLRAIKRTDMFEQLIKNHPRVVFDILDKVIDNVKPQAATTPAQAPAQAPAPAP
jgi:speckle-type POZ protein